MRSPLVGIVVSCRRSVRRWPCGCNPFLVHLNCHFCAWRRRFFRRPSFALSFSCCHPTYCFLATTCPAAIHHRHSPPPPPAADEATSRIVCRLSTAPPPVCSRSPGHFSRISWVTRDAAPHRTAPSSIVFLLLRDPTFPVTDSEAPPHQRCRLAGWRLESRAPSCLARSTRFPAAARETAGPVSRPLGKAHLMARRTR